MAAIVFGSAMRAAPAVPTGACRRMTCLAPRASLSDSRTPQAKACQGRVLPLLSDYVQAQASVTRFERLAGRTAMVGAAVALATEALLPSAGGLFGSAASSGVASELAAIGFMLLCCSAFLAARLRRPFSSRRLLEPVIASLTSKRRSFAGVTQTNVDRAVDSALDAVFTSRFMITNSWLDEDRFI